MTDTPTPEIIVTPLEIRETDEGPLLHGCLIQEGRAAGSRAEVFSPMSVHWPAEGLEIRTEHLGAVVAKAIPIRSPDGSIRIATRATPEIRSAVSSGKKFLSIEFVALRQTRTGGGIREINKAFVPSAALVSSPEYQQARVEIRSQSRARRWR